LQEPTTLDQDWEICSADCTRISEFLVKYNRAPALTDDEKFTLMEIIVASVDQAMESGPADQALVGALRAVLLNEFDLHAFTIYYWCLWDRGCSPPRDEMFEVTPIMRELWRSRMKL
jgi:hypothetical protein